MLTFWPCPPSTNQIIASEDPFLVGRGMRSGVKKKTHLVRSLILMNVTVSLSWSSESQPFKYPALGKQTKWRWEKNGLARQKAMSGSDPITLVYKPVHVVQFLHLKITSASFVFNQAPSDKRSTLCSFDIVTCDLHHDPEQVRLALADRPIGQDYRRPKCLRCY